MEGRVLEGDEDLLVLAVFGEVDAHAFESVGSEKRYEAGVLLFHLVGDVLKTFAHGVFDHLLLGFLDLLEAFVEVLENLREEGRSRLIEGLFDGCDPLLVDVDGVHQELRHVAE
jgi:hypothetical protein